MERDFLGRDLLLPGERMPVLIFGTDQSEGDWLHFLRRETLVDETQALIQKLLISFAAWSPTSSTTSPRKGSRP